jgi:hypothetical protein
MPTVFEHRRLATTAETAAVVASFDAARGAVRGRAIVRTIP